SSTDLALQSRLALDLRRAGVPVPVDLAAAEQQWYSSVDLPGPLATPAHNPDHDHDHLDADFDSELASIYDLQLSAQGQLLNGAGQSAGLAPVMLAVTAALANGSDWRTTRLPDGTRVRLLTYRMAGAGPVAVIQLGRTLGDVDRLL